MGTYEIDVTKNIMKIDIMKSNILSSISEIFKLMSKGINVDLNEIAGEEIANIIVNAYMLGRRMGIDYGEIDAKIAGTLGDEGSNDNSFIGEDIRSLEGYLKG